MKTVISAICNNAFVRNRTLINPAFAEKNVPDNVFCFKSSTSLRERLRDFAV